MKSYEAKDIKNVVMIGHAGSGKTSLCEALLYKVKAIDRMGKVEEGTTVSDYSEEEIKRRTTLNLSLLPFEYKGKKVNLIDAPGQFDFEAEEKEAIFAADSVIIVVSGKSGVTVGVKKAYEAAKEADKSIIFFITKIDSENANFYKVLEGLKSQFGPSVCPFVAPVYKEEKADCLVDLIRKKAYRYEDGMRKEIETPDMEHRLEGLENAINEAVAESDEKLFDKYFSGEQFTLQEIIKGIDEGILSRSICPILCGSAHTLAGIEILLDSIVELFPSTEQIKEKFGFPKGFVGKIFKTTVDPFYGKLSYIRVYSGSLKTGDIVQNKRTDQSVRVNKLISLFGKRQNEIGAVNEGDIATVAKLNVNTNDQLYSDKPLQLSDIVFKAPNYMKAIYATKDESKVSSAIGKLLEEDPSYSFYINEETKQQILCGMSKQHLEVAVSKLKDRFMVEVELKDVKYRIEKQYVKRSKLMVDIRNKQAVMVNLVRCG